MSPAFSPAVLEHVRANAPALAAGTVDYGRLLDDYPGQFDFYDSRDHLATVTAAGLAAGARVRAGGLAARGVGRGDRVVMVASNDERFLTTLLGVLLLGAVPCAVAPPPTPSRPESAGVQHLRAAVRVTDPRLVIGTAATAVALPGTELVDGDELAVGEPLSAVDRQPAQPGDVHHVQLTSGSTSQPKAVVLTHANVAHNLGGLGWAMGVRAGAERVFSWLPMYHDMGLIQVLDGLAHGASIAMMSPLGFLRAPLSWARHMTHHGSTVTAGPTFAYRAATEALDRDPRGGAGIDLSAVRHAFVGAEPIGYETLRRFSDRFAACGLRSEALVPCYGMAESVLATTLALAPAPPGPGNFGRVRTVDSQDGSAALVSCGRPVDGMQVAIVDDRGVPRPAGVVGTITIAGPSLMAGYRSDECADDASKNRWFDTGDLGFLCGGELFVTGRRKEMLIIRGRNLPPYDVEAAIGELPEVGAGQVAVFSVPDETGAWELVVAVVGTGPLDDDGRLRVKAAVANRVREVFGIVLHDVLVVPKAKIPRTTSGKIRRLALRRCYQAG